MLRAASISVAHRNTSRRLSSFYDDRNVDLKPKIPSNKSEFKFEMNLDTLLNGVCAPNSLDNQG